MDDWTLALLWYIDKISSEEKRLYNLLFVSRCRSSRGGRVWVTLSTCPESNTCTAKSSCLTGCAWCWGAAWPSRFSSARSRLELRTTWRRSHSPPTLRYTTQFVVQWLWCSAMRVFWWWWWWFFSLTSGGAVWDEWEGGAGVVRPAPAGRDGPGETIQRGDGRADRWGGQRAGGESVRPNPAAHQGQEGAGGDGETGEEGSSCWSSWNILEIFNFSIFLTGSRDKRRPCCVKAAVFPASYDSESQRNRNTETYFHLYLTRSVSFSFTASRHRSATICLEKGRLWQDGVFTHFEMNNNHLPTFCCGLHLLSFTSDDLHKNVAVHEWQ